MGSNFFVKVVIIRKALCHLAEGFSQLSKYESKTSA